MTSVTQLRYAILPLAERIIKSVEKSRGFFELSECSLSHNRGKKITDDKGEGNGNKKRNSSNPD